MQDKDYDHTVPNYIAFALSFIAPVLFAYWTTMILHIDKAPEGVLLVSLGVWGASYWLWSWIVFKIWDKFHE